MSKPSDSPSKRKSELIWQAVKSLARAPAEAEPDTLTQHDTLSTFGLRREFSSDGNHGFMEFALASGCMTVMRSAFSTSAQQVSIATTDRDVLRIRLGLSGSIAYQDPVSGEHKALDSPSCLVVSQSATSELEMVVPENEEFRYVGFVIPRGTIVDTLGFDPSLLPEAIRTFEAGESTSLTISEIAMSSAMLSIATDMLNCSFRGALLDQFLEAKLREVLCYIVLGLQEAGQTSADEPEKRLSSRDRKALAVARNIIDQTYAEPPPLTALARKVGLNRNKLCSGFRSSYGLTIHEYARELRLQKALTLLREGSISITEVAERVGYGHSSTLTAAIKRRFGVSPKQLKG